MVGYCKRNSSSISSTSCYVMSSISTRRGVANTTTTRTSNKRNTTTNNNNKTFEKPIRRKWILEKWPIWITFLLASILLDCAYGDVMCYECAWQGSTPLPSTTEGVSDVCRPHNFDVEIVHKIKCANGCMKQALYEFENDQSSPPRGTPGPNSNSSSTNRTRSINLDNNTFYLRGCQKEKKTREACENKSFNDQVYAEECVCLSDFCNGESSGGMSSKIFSLLSSATTRGRIHRSNDYPIIPTTFSIVNRNLVELSAVAITLNLGISKLLSITATSPLLVSFPLSSSLPSS